MQFLQQEVGRFHGDRCAQNRESVCDNAQFLQIFLNVGWAEMGGEDIRVSQNGIGAKNAPSELSHVADV